MADCAQPNVCHLQFAIYVLSYQPCGASLFASSKVFSTVCLPKRAFKSSVLKIRLLPFRKVKVIQKLHLLSRSMSTLQELQVSSSLSAGSVLTVDHTPIWRSFEPV